jgi:hypothetical protein
VDVSRTLSPDRVLAYDVDLDVLDAGETLLEGLATDCLGREAVIASKLSLAPAKGSNPRIAVSV